MNLSESSTETFPVNGAFERFLRFTGLSISDEMLRIKKDVLDATIHRRSPRRGDVPRRGGSARQVHRCGIQREVGCQDELQRGVYGIVSNTSAGDSQAR